MFWLSYQWDQFRVTGTHPPNPLMEPVNLPIPVVPRKPNRNDCRREVSQRIQRSTDYVKIPYEYRSWTPEVRRNWFDTHPTGTLWTTGQKKLRKEARDDCIATIGSGSGSELVALENELVAPPLVAPPLVAPPPVNCMLTIGPGPGINSEASELVEPTPVPNSH